MAGEARPGETAPSTQAGMLVWGKPAHRSCRFILRPWPKSAEITQLCPTAAQAARPAVTGVLWPQWDEVKAESCSSPFLALAVRCLGGREAPHAGLRQVLAAARRAGRAGVILQPPAGALAKVTLDKAGE